MFVEGERRLHLVQTSIAKLTLIERAPAKHV